MTRKITFYWVWNLFRGPEVWWQPTSPRVMLRKMKDAVKRTFWGGKYVDHVIFNLTGLKLKHAIHQFLISFLFNTESPPYFRSSALLFWSLTNGSEWAHSSSWNFLCTPHRPGLARLAETSVLNLLVRKMSHPTPSDKPANPENPRVFFDVDVGGQRGQNILILKSSYSILTASWTASFVSLAHSWLILVTCRNWLT